MFATGDGDAGFVMFMIWMPLSLKAVTRAYVKESKVTVVMAREPFSIG